MQKKFIADGDKGGVDEALGLALEFIHDRLGELKLNAKDTNRAVLMCEESLLRLFKYGSFPREKNGAFRVNVWKFFGDVFIDLTVPGSEFDFAGSLELSSEANEELTPDAEAAIQNLMLRSFADSLRYRHSKNGNRITVKAFQSNYSGLYKTLTALFFAVVTGLAVKSFLPESIYMSVNDNILATARNIFMNGLKMCATPIVFFSIAASASDMENFSGIRRSGMRLLWCFLVMQVIAVIVGFGIVGLFGTGKGANLPAVSAQSVNTGGLSIADTLLNLMPENIERTFLEGNMLQMILVALLMGAAAAAAGARIVIHLFNEFNRLYMKITSYLIKFMPLVIFCSVASMIITTGLNTILSMIGLLLTLWGGYFLMNVFFCLVLKFYAGLNPAVMYKKSLPVIITGFTTCSSSACLPDMIKSAETMGISRKLYAFSLPLGISIARITTSLCLAVITLSAANMYGINITWGGLLSLGISIIVLDISTPALPTVTIIALSVLLSQIKVPLDFVPLVMGIDTLHDVINTPSNGIGILTSTLTVAAKEKLIDLETYNRK